VRSRKSCWTYVPAKNKRFVLKVKKDTLKGAPGFDMNNWPNIADQAWMEKIHSYYRIEPDQDATSVTPV